VHAIRECAEQLKSYEPELVEELRACLREHAATVQPSATMSADIRAGCERLVAQIRAVNDAIDRVQQYPEVIMARAVVLDQASTLAKRARELLATLGQ